MRKIFRSIWRAMTDIFKEELWDNGVECHQDGINQEDYEMIESLMTSRLKYLGNEDYHNAANIEEYLASEGIEVTGDWNIKQWINLRDSNTPPFDITKLKITHYDTP